MRLAFCLFLLVASGCETQRDWTQEDWISHWEQQAERGDRDAKFRLAFERFVDGDTAGVADEFEALAREDNLDAIGMLAYMYRDGDGVEQDYERSAYWLERAARLGSERHARDLAAYRARSAPGASGVNEARTAPEAQTR
ncbi:SEL1-like repeat protein [Rubricoccus marinus]|uniref:Sel1 repeat family protein n=1 Tax=Rubricoccus marinus TaxID=716817 RepID=A0A259TVU2_9BACT|nr:SEL1-like repeat protein [Rubricoccus marinus]OZC01668.1 hypothetical protein BSZ36_00930 [Rubricoccus marinus]